MKILKLNSISPIADETFRGYEYSDSVENPEGIILRSFAMHDYPLGEDLLAVARAGAGVNNIPIEKCTEQGIVVFNTPGANANAVKELVLCELFLGGRKVVDGANWVQSLKGQEGVGKLVEKGKGKFAGQEVLGKTLGVIGLGAIGAMVANAAIDLGMSVMGYDPYISVKNAWLINNRVKFTSELSAIFANCDYITLHVPLTPATKGMIGKDSIAACKDGVVIINTSRGTNVDEAALLAGLESGKVRAAGLDVYADEPATNKALYSHPMVSCTPHIGAATVEAQKRIGAEIVDIISKM